MKKELLFLIMGVTISQVSNVDATRSSRGNLDPKEDSLPVEFKAAQLKYDSSNNLYHFGQSIAELPRAHRAPLLEESELGVIGNLEPLNGGRQAVPVLLYDSTQDSFLKSHVGSVGAAAGAATGLGASYFFDPTPLLSMLSITGLSGLGSYTGSRLLSENPSSGEAESILGWGVDCRTCVKDSDVRSWPYRVHGHMVMYFSKTCPYIGSGTLVGNQYVLTAGHNLYDHDTDRHPIAVEFYPGLSGKRAPWFASAEKFFLHPDYKKPGSVNLQKNSDIGMIKLDKPLGRELGFFGLRSLKEDEKINVNVTGYPLNPGGGKYMHTMEGPLLHHEDHRSFYKIDTSGGQSGSGVWVKSSEDEYDCVAVHTYAASKKSSLQHENLYNSGTRLNAENMRLIEHWLKN